MGLLLAYALPSFSTLAFSFLRPAFFSFPLFASARHFLLVAPCFLLFLGEKQRLQKGEKCNREEANTVFKNYMTKHSRREQEGKLRREKEQYKDRWKMKGQREERERKREEQSGDRWREKKRVRAREMESEGERERERERERNTP